MNIISKVKKKQKGWLTNKRSYFEAVSDTYSKQQHMLFIMINEKDLHT